MYKFYPHPFEGCVNIESILDSLQKIKGYLKHWNTMYNHVHNIKVTHFGNLQYMHILIVNKWAYAMG